MRLCRFEYQGQPAAGLYDEESIVAMEVAAAAYAKAGQGSLEIPHDANLLQLLPNGSSFNAASELSSWVAANPESLPSDARIPTSSVQLLMPIPRPNKLFLLAGNYASHIEEGGDVAAERADTFPYVFMKPPTTTLNHPGQPIRIPTVSPEHIDWELELAVVIGKLAKGVREAEALDHVAGYTVINDISDRKFQPFPDRKPRESDKFFDWLHGKWHDSFCPCGPCVTSADAIPDPQQLDMELTVNGEVHQHANTSSQIFPVAAVIEFISSFVTLEPGDIISTGTSAGVGSAKGIFLQPGDSVEASIESIGTVVSPVAASG